MSEDASVTGPEIGQLVEALGSDEPSVRNGARELLARTSRPGSAAADSALVALGQAVSGSPDPDVRILAATALGESGNREASRPLCDALGDAEANVRAAAADALGLLADPSAVEPLARAAGSPDDWTALSAVSALGQIRERSALPALERAASNPLLASAAVQAIGRIGVPEGLEALRPAVAFPAAREALHRAAADILGSCDSCDAPGWLRDTLTGREAQLGEALRARHDHRAARLLGLAGTDAAIRELSAAAGADTEAARAVALALGFLPPEAAGRVLFAVLPGASPQIRSELLTALPALRDPALLREVAARLADPEPDVAAAAAEALAASQGTAVEELLTELLDQPASRAGAIEALSRRGELSAERLLPLLNDERPAARHAAARGIGRLPRAGTLDAEALARALEREEHPEARHALIQALGRHAGARGVELLRDRLAENDAGTRFAAVAALGESDAPEAAFPVLLSLLEEPALEIRAAALRALGELGDPRAGAPLARALDENEKELRRAAASALEALPAPRVLDRLRQALDDVDWKIRLAAVRTLARIGGPDAREWLAEAAGREVDPLVRRAATEATSAG